jgi:hypothetical protein
MDPNQALADFRSALEGARRSVPGSAEHQHYLALAVSATEALDEWLTGGGFPPDDWTVSNHDAGRL